MFIFFQIKETVSLKFVSDIKGEIPSHEFLCVHTTSVGIE
jgi:hypothetical protein